MKSEPGLAQPNSVVGVSNALPKPPKQLLHYKVAPRSRVTSEKQKKTKIGFSFSLYFFCYSFLWHCLSDLFEFCRPTWDWGKMPRQLFGYFFSFLSFFFLLSWAVCVAWHFIPVTLQSYLRRRVVQGPSSLLCYYASRFHRHKAGKKSRKGFTKKVQIKTSWVCSFRLVIRALSQTFFLIYAVDVVNCCSFSILIYLSGWGGYFRGGI